MGNLTREEIRHLAELARLHLTDAEVQKFEAELPQIIAFVDELQKVAADNVDELAAAHRIVNAFRSDSGAAIPPGNPEDLKEAFLASDQSGNLVIPPVFDRSEQ